MMAKEFKVFFSWQSDLPANQTKRFIEESIELAKSLLPESILLIPDEATRNRLGSPDIMSSIFEKIDDCDLFIADVSIVGKYSLQTDDETIEKSIPNSNVILELGYAAAKLTWERCICFANTKFGPISEMPFDLNHRRITDISYANCTRKQKISDIAEIIKSTVIAYIDKPIAKTGFSHHIVGGFDLENRIIKNHIIPYNDTAMALFDRKTEKLIEKASEIVEKISQIQIPDRGIITEDDDLDAIPENMTISDILKDPELSKRFSQKLTNARDIKMDKQALADKVKRYLGIELSDDFYCLGDLKEIPPMFSFNSPSLEGSDEEKEKYTLICNLNDLLLTLELREMFKNLFNGVVIIPLAIKNSSTKSDERISITIKIVEGNPVSPTAHFFNSDYIGMEGYVYDEHLVEELLMLPENITIKHDSSLPQYPTPYISETPRFDAFGNMFTPASDQEDYEQELQEYVQDVDEGTNDEYSFLIGALRPNETVWLDKVMLIKPVDGKIIIDYSVKSNNTTGYIEGRLSLN